MYKLQEAKRVIPLEKQPDWVAREEARNPKKTPPTKRSLFAGDFGDEAFEDFTKAFLDAVNKLLPNQHVDCLDDEDVGNPHYGYISVSEDNDIEMGQWAFLAEEEDGFVTILVSFVDKSNGEDGECETLETEKVTSAAAKRLDANAILALMTGPANQIKQKFPGAN